MCWHSVDLGDGEEAPDDEEGIVPIPHKKGLDLGRALVMRFAREVMPDDEDTIEAFFRRRGACGSFKDFLQRRGVLERWHDFENRATEQAMLAWCEENDVELVDDIAGDDAS